MNHLLEAHAFGPSYVLAGLDAHARLDHKAHLAAHGRIPSLDVGELLSLSLSIGLRERDHRCLRFADELQCVLDSAAHVGRTSVVVCGDADELGGAKDRTLLQRTPHLVLDGALLAATAIGAQDIVVTSDSADARCAVRTAIAERTSRDKKIRVSSSPPETFDAALDAATYGDGLRLERSGTPTLVTNTETLAQLAVAARRGACAFGSTGLPSEPGTMLLDFAHTWIVETPTGVPLRYLLQFCALSAGQGVLVGGYGGKWLPPEVASHIMVSRDSLVGHGAGFGDGTILTMPESTCPLGEVGRVADWLAKKQAQCCTCCAREVTHMVWALNRLVTVGGQAPLDLVDHSLAMLDTPAACSHARRVGQFVDSAITVFSGDLAAHLHGAGCGRPIRGHLPVTAPESRSRQWLLVDRARCVGSGRCARALSRSVTLEPDGYPAGVPVDVHPQERDEAANAVRRCPTGALRLVSPLRGEYPLRGA
ncbi:NADH-quinone oxidoreductase subunit NuoF family protein [Streptomyces halobius]|uniref:Ferredoxin n=1 Tax=Streptomyces halobius TaxID=2879846 RepID=A0ABY4MJ87_9ACTN|nr:NADH-quinone oxidoreductase subunit NuoF family protein [Streptomyces halobius]UQA97277.1 ferredoxin [Streptomyces halobius]